MQDTHNVYKIDRFKVPKAAQEAFLNRVRLIHEHLRTLPGFVEDRLLTQEVDDDSSHLLTLVVWENEEALQSARQNVASLYAREQFNPQELMARLGVVPDMGIYRPLQ
jgi:quinol monooxygenase YgiN